MIEASKIRLKCFVASAFQKADVDAVYDQAIKPTLEKLGVQSFRVDRLQHNDDIDDKILQLIKECDFSIADLTYARPSVYYEAGRIEGLEKPVIFIAKSDHFRPKAKDKYGNFRIHFDLQMRNIIQWSDDVNRFKKISK